MKIKRSEYDEMLALLIKQAKTTWPDMDEDNLRVLFCRGYYYFRNKAKEVEDGQ